MSWEIKDLAGNVTGTIEKIPEGLGPIGWIVLGHSLFEEPSAIKVVLFLSGIIAFCLSILGIYAIATMDSQTISDSETIIPVLGSLSLTYLVIAGSIITIVFALKEQ